MTMFTVRSSLACLAGLAGGILVLCLLHKPVAAQTLPTGKKTIVLIAADGSELSIGHVSFEAVDGGARIAVSLDAAEFQDEFLSMRPFRCLPNPKESWCHLVYPYDTRNHVTSTDLVDLEYALLFLYRSPTEYGINAWNGLYFKLSLGNNGVITGAVHETDLNVLAVPPEEPLARPVTHVALTEVSPDAHRFARIEIR